MWDRIIIAEKLWQCYSTELLRQRHSSSVVAGTLLLLHLIEISLSISLLTRPLSKPNIAPGTWTLSLPVLVWNCNIRFLSHSSSQLYYPSGLEWRRGAPSFATFSRWSFPKPSKFSQGNQGSIGCHIFGTFLCSQGLNLVEMRFVGGFLTSLQITFHELRASQLEPKFQKDHLSFSVGERIQCWLSLSNICNLYEIHLMLVVKTEFT